jgi:3-oxoacyl-[acyl-carrier protein] reductase
MFTLKSKIALVTGAGRGIGRAIAQQLAAAGATVMLNDLDRGPLEEAQAAIAGSMQCAGDLTDPSFPQQLIDRTIADLGGLDIIVNNAGYTWDTVIQKMTDEQWDAILDVHLTAPFSILRAAQPYLSAAAKAERARGERVQRKVVNVSSGSGVNGNPGQANYSSAKAGIIGLTKALAKEWGRYQVNVNAVAFGIIRTRMTEARADGGTTLDIGGRQIRAGVNPYLLDTLPQRVPLGRGGSPAEAAGAVYLLCTPEADYISGQVLLCNGGLN